MSICIISAKTKIHYNPQHIDQVKPKSEGVGASAPKVPLDPPLITAFNQATVPEHMHNTVTVFTYTNYNSSTKLKGFVHPL